MQKGKVKYIGLAEQLTRYISSQEVKNGILPPERELAEYFAVSRGTLRKALALIQNKGLIDKKIGAGNFVSPSKYSKDLTTISSITEYIEATHLDIYVELSDFQKNIMLPENIPFFPMLKGCPMHHFIRVVYIQGQPRWYEEFFLRADIFPEIEEKDIGDILKYTEGSLHLKVGPYFQTIQVRTPERSILEKLQVKKMPLMSVHSHATLQDRRVFQASIQYFHPDYQLHMVGHR